MTDASRRVPTRTIPALALLATSACFPTFHSPKVEPGLRLDSGFLVLADQERNGEPQGTDALLTVAPVYGFGERLEIGIPVGLYWEEGIGVSGYTTGTGSENFVIQPYAKLALHEPGARTHAALVAQGIGVIPSSVGVRLGRDLGGWEPQVGLTWIASGGPAGDDPYITRYQEEGQQLWVASVGATWDLPGRPAAEIGVLRNRYQEGAVHGDFGQGTTPRTLYDLFVSIRLGLGGRRQ